MPGIGYYALAIEAWWFNLIFYIICIYLYPTNLENKKGNIFFANFLPFLILPFAVPYDREAIVIVAISVFVFLINYTLQRIREIFFTIMTIHYYTN